MHDYLCVSLEDYRDDPDNVQWVKPDYAYDVESAARIYMEETGDPHGSFGRGESRQTQVEVLVLDLADQQIHLVEVHSAPEPGYRSDLLDEHDADMYHGVDLTEVKRPNDAQIPE